MLLLIRVKVIFLRSFLILLIGLVTVTPALAQRDPPYWASIDEDEARMRTGPSTDFPTLWVYKRKRLPIKILARYRAWRKVEDHEGAQGWMHARLLSAQRTGLVLDQIRALREKPSKNSKITWRVEPGVVGAIRNCGNGWCLFDVSGRQGYIPARQLWGTVALKGQ